MNPLQEKITSLENEILRLKEAIREANDWLEAGEGVDLLYYMESNRGDRQYIDTINSVIQEGIRK